VPGVDDAVEQWLNRRGGDYALMSVDIGDESAFRACLRYLFRFGSDVFRHLGVLGDWCQVAEDPWRIDDRCLLRMRERNLDDLDTK